MAREIKPERTAYDRAKARCSNTKVREYRWYGARGIKFKFTSFQSFMSELGMRPSPDHSLDRINNDGNYEPGNVRWATRQQQMANKRPRAKNPMLRQEWMRNWMRERRKLRRQLGLCVMCGSEKAVKNRVNGKKCLKRQRENAARKLREAKC